MGGTISSQTGGGRSIKEIKDSIEVAKAKIPLDEEEISKLAEELSAALAQKEELVAEINTLKAEATPDNTKISDLETILTVLTLGDEPTNAENNGAAGNAKSNFANSTANSNKNTESNDGAVSNENAELAKKLEKCKQKPAKAEEEADVENAQKRIKEEVPSFFKTFFGNWFSYDNWQMTEDEKERNECQELLAAASEKKKDEKEGNNGNDGDESIEANGERTVSTETNGERTEGSIATSTSNAETASYNTMASVNTPVAADPNHLSTSTLPPTVTEPKPDVPAPVTNSAATPKAGGRRYTHKRKRSAKLSE